MASCSCPCQPRNIFDAEPPESEGEGESGIEEDGLVYDSRDFEIEPTLDDWFDAFISQGSSQSVATTEPEPATPKPIQAMRPIARPLNHEVPSGPSGGSDVQMIEDSPIKIEEVDGDKVGVEDLKNQKLKEIEQLRAHLAKLEIQMTSAAWDPHLLGMSIHAGRLTKYSLQKHLMQCFFANSCVGLNNAGLYMIWQIV